MKSHRTLCLLALVFCIASPLLAQSTNGTISGRVMDSVGKVIPDADVRILNDATAVQYPARTNGAGIYAVSILPPGQYRVQVSKSGFRTLIKPDIILNVQSAIALNFTLPVGATSESVTVEAGTSMINTTDASVSAVIDRKFVENIPLNGRSFQDLISMTPGVVTQSPQAAGQYAGLQGDFSVNGQRTESNSYTVDGVSGNVSAGYPRGYPQSANSGSIGATTALGTTQSLVSVDALQEFRVSSSTYSAEYGRTPGGQFSLSTRAGTNMVHGSVFNYLRNDVFDANDWFNNHTSKAKTPLRQNDFGGTFGAPFSIPHLYQGRDRTFLFASYEGLRLTQPTASTIQYVPSSAVRAAAPSTIKSILNAFPVPSGPEILSSTGVLTGLAPFVAPYSSPSQIDSTSIRLDEVLSPKAVLFFRFGDTPSTSQSRNLSTVIQSRMDSRTYTLGLTSQLPERVTNELRVGLADSRSSGDSTLDAFGGATPTDLLRAVGIPGSSSGAANIYISISGVGTSSISTGVASTSLRQWNITDTLTMQASRHHLRFGIDERRMKSPLNPQQIIVSPDLYSRQAMISNVATDISIQKAVPSVPVFNEFSAFGQDEWHIGKSISLSLGLRWEVNPPPGEKHGNLPYTLAGDINAPSTLGLAPHGTALWKTSWYNFAPRIGAAWTASHTPGHETVLRAGGGVFFDTGNQSATNGFQGVGFLASTDPKNVPIPITAQQLNFTTDPVAPYIGNGVYVFPSHLQLPYTLQWSTSLEQGLGKAQSLTISYVGSNGRRLLQEQRRNVTALNSNFGYIYYFPNGVTSSYNSLQLKFQRSISPGLQVLTSYTWSHSIDFGSTNASYPLNRGNSDFDVRHNFQSGISWDLSRPSKHVIANAVIGGWSVNARLLIHTGFPITLLGNQIRDPFSGNLFYTGVNYDGSKPSYVYGPQYPGGRSLNGGPTVSPTIAAFILPSGTNAGTAARNFVRGFGAAQMNLALQRTIHLKERFALQFRAEAFNLTNHPNFGYINPTLSNAQFGQATKMLNQSLGSMSSLYQQGGARSMQFALKATF